MEEERSEGRAVISRQVAVLAVGSWQLAVGSGQLAVVSSQLSVGGWQLPSPGKFWRFDESLPIWPAHSFSADDVLIHGVGFNVTAQQPTANSQQPTPN
jgi:hypothetical protein